MIKKYFGLFLMLSFFSSHFVFANELTDFSSNYEKEQTKQIALGINKKGTQAYHKASYKKAIVLYKIALRISPKLAQVYSNLGLAFQKQQNFTLAISANQKAIQFAEGANRNRVKASAHYNIARIYEGQSKWQLAKKSYLSALNFRYHDAYQKGLKRVSSKANARGSGDASKFVKKMWLALGTTKNRCLGQFNYFPNGGMKIFYCHFKSVTSFNAMKLLVPMPIFLSGAHQDKLDFDSAYTFGHYNPSFVKWLGTNFIPKANSKLKIQTQRNYDKYVRQLARTYYAVHQKLKHNPRYFAKQKKIYSTMMNTRDLLNIRSHVYKFYGFMDLNFLKTPFYDRNSDNRVLKKRIKAINGNVAKGAFLFWLRRSIDGTDKEFFKNLKKLMQVYDVTYLQIPSDW
ncbi:MAG: tetratricopeptide (TPR) repeat protein [bacterium]|jgi:tetratricopeptide (TPR) repeat protein